MRSENQAMNILLQRQYDQYRLSIDNIELLRREFHDLKHYMIAIRSEQDPKRRNNISPKWKRRSIHKKHSPILETVYWMWF